MSKRLTFMAMQSGDVGSKHSKHGWDREDRKMMARVTYTINFARVLGFAAAPTQKLLRKRSTCAR